MLSLPICISSVENKKDIITPIQQCSGTTDINFVEQ